MSQIIDKNNPNSVWIYRATIICKKCKLSFQIAHLQQDNLSDVKCPKCYTYSDYADLEHFKFAQYVMWWDGDRRFGNINRNLTAFAQRERDYAWIASLYPDGKGLEIGGSALQARGCQSVSPESANNPDLKIDGRTLDGIDNESIDYIVSSHVFEHMDQAPILTLKRWLEVLKVGGMILIIMPDKTYFKHDSKVTKEFDAAVNEMTPKDMYSLLDYLHNTSPHRFEVLLFDTHKNNFDFDILLKKS